MTYDSFFLLDTETAKDYARHLPGLFSPGETLECREIGDGNINYVFQVRSREGGRSVVIKQADRLLRSSGRPLDQNRSRLEAEALRLQGELAAGLVPELYAYDKTMCTIVMEDISDYRNLRKALADGFLPEHLAENLSDFVAQSLLPTTDLVLDRAEKKRRVQFFTNPELCDITEDLVFTEPYHNYKNRNLITPGNEEFVREHLYEDASLHARVAKLRNRFMNHAQTLLHGDLHSGSIFVNEEGIKVIDPEFAFYGPMGYDIGNVIGNLFFAYARARAEKKEEFAQKLAFCISDFFDHTREKLAQSYDTLVQFPLYRCDAFKEGYLGDVMLDALGYAGTEIIRRVVGDAKVSELTGLADLSLRIPMERALIRFGSRLILEPEAIHSGGELLTVWED